MKEKEDAYNELKEEMQKAETLNRLGHWKLYDESIFENAVSFNESKCFQLIIKNWWKKKYWWEIIFTKICKKKKKKRIDVKKNLNINVKEWHKVLYKNWQHSYI